MLKWENLFSQVQFLQKGIKDKRKIGFTLLEIVLVIVLLAIFLLGIGYFIWRSITSWNFLSSRFQAEQDARLCFSYLMRDLREIAVDENGNPLIANASSTAISFTNSDGDTISYSLSNKILYRNSDPLVTNVNEFKIQYYNQKMIEINPVSQEIIKTIWLLKVSLSLKIGDEILSYYSYVYPRNFRG